MSGPSQELPAVTPPETTQSTERDQSLDTGQGSASTSIVAASDPIDDEVNSLKGAINAAQGGNRMDFIRQANAAIMGASPEARTRLYGDQEYMRSAFFESNPASLDWLVRSLDPVRHLCLAIRSGRARERWSAERVRDEIQTWATANASIARTALTRAELLDGMRMWIPQQEVRIQAIQALIYGGQIPQTPRQALDLALAAPDETQFRSTWQEITTDQDTALLTQLSQDAAFLQDVEGAFGGGTYEQVVATLARADEMQSAQDAVRLGPLVDICLAELDELNDYWHVHDATVVSALRTLDAGVRDAFPELTGDALTPKRDMARHLVATRFQSMYGKTLTNAIERGLSGSAETAALELVNLSPSGAPPMGMAEFEIEKQAIADQHTGHIHSEMDSILYVSDTAVAAKVERAFADFRALAERVGANEAHKIQLSYLGMAHLKTTYDRQFGSLVRDLHSYVQTETIRARALQLLGDRNDPALASMLQAASQTAECAEDGSSQVSEGDSADVLLDSAEAIQPVAHEFYDAVESRSTRSLTAAVTHLLGIDSQLDTSRRVEMVSQYYQPLGGSLRYGIAEAFSNQRGLVNPQLERMGLGSVERILGGQQSAGESEELIDARLDANSAAERLFNSVERMTADPERRQSMVHVGLRNYLDSATTLDRVQTASTEEPYRTVNGIDLVHHLGLSLRGSEFGSAEEILGRPIPPMVEVRRGQAEDADLDESTLNFNEFAASSKFSLEEARTRAITIHEEMHNAQGTTFQLTQNGNQEELRIVVAVFEQLYGYNPLYTIRETQESGALSDDEAQTLQRRLEDAGQATFATRILDMVQANDVNRVYEILLRASPSDRQSVLNDEQTLVAIRRSVNTEEWDRIYATLGGDLSLGDALRTREGGWWFGWGTDEQGMESDTQLMLANIKTQLQAADPQNADANFRQQCIRMWADPQIQEILHEQLNAEELIKMEQIVLRGGEQTATDQVFAEAESLGNNGNILTHLRAMTDPERELRRNDPRFIDMLARQLNGTQLEQAMMLLNGEHGRDGEVDIEAALRNDGRLNANALFEAVLALNTADLIALMNNPARIAEIRSRLQYVPSHLATFNSIVEEARSLGESSLVEHGDDGVNASASGGEEQFLAHLILQHTHRLRVALDRGRDYALAAAQAVFAEKGEAILDPECGGAKVELFDNAARDRVWAGMEGKLREEYGHVAEFVSVIENAVKGVTDPSAYRLEYGFSGWDNAEAINSALSSASNQTYINEWSNIKKAGEDGRSLRTAYNEWQAAKAEVQGTSQPTPDQIHAEQAYHYRFVDFPIDVAGDLVTVLQDQNWIPMTGTTTRDLLSYKQVVRAKLVALPSNEVAAAIGVDGADEYDTLAQDDSRRTEIDAVNGTDRQARSMHAHVSDVARHNMSVASLADGFTYTDEQMAVYWSHYAGAYGEATERQDGEELPFGTINEAESAEITARRERFEVSVEEYKKAKAKVAQVMKWVAIAVIGAVATALTGPGGPTLIAALVTAGVQAGASVAIDEMVLGNDYDASTEGVVQIVTDVAMAGAGHKLSAMWDAAVAGGGWARQIQDKFDTISQFEDQLKAAAGQGDWGGQLAWEAGKAAVKVPMGDVQDAAVTALDPSNLKYGWNQGVTQAQELMDSRMRTMDERVLRAVITATGEVLGSEVERRVRGDSGPSELPGTEHEELDIEARNRDFLELMTASAQENLGGDAVLSALWSQSVGSATGALGTLATGGSVGISEDDVAGFGFDLLQGRAGKFIGGVGEEAQNDRTSQLVARRAAEFREYYSGGDADLALQHYVAYVRSGGSLDNTDQGDVLRDQGNNRRDDPHEFIQRTWRPLQREIDAQTALATPGPMNANYRAWVLEDPSKSTERSRTSVADFAEQYETGERRAERMRNTDEYKAFNPEQKAFYDVFLSNPMRLASVGDYSQFDIGSSSGMANFEEAMTASKQAMAARYLPDVTQNWNSEDLAAFSTHLRTTALETTAFDPNDHDANRASLRAAAEAWQNRAQGTEQALIESEVVNDESAT